MKIRLMSDLHTEFKLPYTSQPFSEYRGEDVLVLAGDIASGSTNTIKVLRWFKSLGYPRVVYVPGNHEYYGTSIEDFDSKMRAKKLEAEGIYFLNGDSLVLDDVIFIGATLWTNFAKNAYSEHAARRMIADFRLIKEFNPPDAIELYYTQLAYIKHMYELHWDKRKVIVTHFLPAQEAISPRFARDGSGLNDYFANRLDNWIREMSNTTWMFGHTHDPIDKLLGDTRIVANPHGYWGAQDEGQDFDPFKTVEI